MASKLQVHILRRRKYQQTIASMRTYTDTIDLKDVPNDLILRMWLETRGGRHMDDVHEDEGIRRYIIMDSPRRFDRIDKVYLPNSAIMRAQLQEMPFIIKRNLLHQLS